MKFPFPDVAQQADLIIYLMLFLGMLLVFDGLRQALGGLSETDIARNRRMRMKRNGVDPQEIEKALLRGRTKRSVSGKRNFIERVERSLSRAALPIGAPALFTGSIALAILLAFVLAEFVSLAPGLAIGGGIGLVLPFAIVNRIANARMAKLTAQLPDALEMMARALRVGHPLNVTLRRVAQEMPDPVGTEFGLIEDRIRHGADIGTAFDDFAERVDTDDVRYLAVCVGIQHGTGGNLARILGVLARVIRDRMNMRKRITAISAEGRLSAIILTAMPFIIIGTIHGTTPSFYGDVVDSPIFLPVAGIVVGIIVLQGLILHRLIDFNF